MNRKEPVTPVAGPGDAYTVIAYLLSGLLLWGGAGMLLDRWLGTRFFVLVGMLVGGGSGLYLVYLRYGRSTILPTPGRPDDD